jgi:hypothetical protein
VHLHEHMPALPVSVLRLLGAHEPVQQDAGRLAAPLTKKTPLEGGA